MDPKSKEFKALQAHWDKKLKQDGFHDIEQADGLLKQWDNLWFHTHTNPILYEAKAEYYRQAEHFLHSHQFDTTTEKIVWQLHSEGFGYREISKALRELGIKRNKDTVGKLVHKLQELMRKS